MDVKTPEVAQLNEALAALDLRTWRESDWVAYEFANRNRAALGIPPTIPFAVRPRLDVTKVYYRPEGKAKAARVHPEGLLGSRRKHNPLGKPFPAQRQITVGATLAIDWESKASARVADLRPEQPGQAGSRRYALAAGRAGHPATGSGRPSARTGESCSRWSVAEAAGGLMRVRSAARTLRLLREEVR